MKKISILLMALVLSMSLAGCSLFSKDQQTSKNNTEQSSSQDNSSDKTTNESSDNSSSDDKDKSEACLMHGDTSNIKFRFKG